MFAAPKVDIMLCRDKRLPKAIRGEIIEDVVARSIISSVVSHRFRSGDLCISDQLHIRQEPRKYPSHVVNNSNLIQLS